MSDLFRSVMGGHSDGLVGSIVEAGSHRLNIQKKVAEGGFAVVYRAVSENTGETVAVKRLLSNDAERKKDAIREAALLRKLDHRNIVKFITAAQMGKNNAGYEELLVVMEWCPCAVPDLLKDRGGFLNRQETTKVMYQTCSALSALHKLQPPHIHRDIKGENLLLTPSGQIKLCDFGSVTTETFVPDDSWSHMQRTKVEEDSQRATTPAYRAPEICDLYSNFPIDKRQDLWAAGCLLILLTTGKHPFEMGEKLAIINGRFMPSTKPEHAPFSSVVKQLLVLDPRKRCQTIPDLMDAIRAIADNCQINPNEAINPIPVKVESPPKVSPSPSQQNSFQHSANSLGEQAGSVLNKAKGMGAGLFSKLKSGTSRPTNPATEPTPSAAPVAPSVQVADLLSDAPTSVPPAQQSNDPFAQWSSNTSTGPSKNQDIFDPLAEAPAGNKDSSGPDLMGNWNSSNILQNQGRANFSNMQQPAAPKAHDPFANLTGLGSTLPSTPMNAARSPTAPAQQRPPPTQQQNSGANGISSTGAWGATFQTRPQAAQAASGGWNPNAYMQTNVNAYKQAQQKAQAPPQQPGQPQKKAGAFDDLLSGFGSNFGQKETGPKKMGDMKKQAENKFRDPITVKVEEWSKGKEANVRALIASLQDVLWEGHSWKPVSVGEILQPAAVKKAYRRAALVCHPDKHTGGEHEKLARAIFMQLAESYTKFEENPSM